MTGLLFRSVEWPLESWENAFRLRGFGEVMDEEIFDWGYPFLRADHNASGKGPRSRAGYYHFEPGVAAGYALSGSLLLRLQ